MPRVAWFSMGLIGQITNTASATAVEWIILAEAVFWLCLWKRPLMAETTKREFSGGNGGGKILRFPDILKTGRLI